MMKTDNLTTKNIVDFTEEDTIYITIPSSRGSAYGRNGFLCQFVKYEKNKVFGIPVKYDGDERMNDWEIKHAKNDGDVISAKLENCYLRGKDGGCNWGDAIGFFKRETETKDDNELSDMPKTHESYGIARFTKTNSQQKPLFGSSIQHKNTIRFQISPGSIDRHLNSDWYSANRNPYIEIEMSQEQFTQLITTMNQGEGVPVTVLRVGDKRMEEVPFQSKMDQFQNEFEERMKKLKEDVENTVADAKLILNSGKNINKAQREHIANSIDKLTSTISSGMPYLTSQFNEQMDKTISEAKGEIESFFDGQIRAAGLEGLKDQIKKLASGADSIDKKIEE